MYQCSSLLLLLAERITVEVTDEHAKNQNKDSLQLQHFLCLLSYPEQYPAEREI